MKLNKDKCHLLVGEYKHESIWRKLSDARMWQSDQQDLLGVHIDRTLFLNKHISNLCKNAGRTLFVLACLPSYMILIQIKVLMKSFIEVQFGYYPIVWMFHG